MLIFSVNINASYICNIFKKYILFSDDCFHGRGRGRGSLDDISCSSGGSSHHSGDMHGISPSPFFETQNMSPCLSYHDSTPPQSLNAQTFNFSHNGSNY